MAPSNRALRYHQKLYDECLPCLEELSEGDAGDKALFFRLTKEARAACDLSVPITERYSKSAAPDVDVGGALARYAAFNGHGWALKRLAEMDGGAAALASTDAQGVTPCMEALRAGHRECVSIIDGAAPGERRKAQDWLEAEVEAPVAAAAAAREAAAEAAGFGGRAWLLLGLAAATAAVAGYKLKLHERVL